MYVKELAGGKFWGIEHDLRVVRGAGLSRPGEPPFTARFDYVYATAGSLVLHGAQPPLPAERSESNGLRTRHAPYTPLAPPRLWTQLRVSNPLVRSGVAGRGARAASERLVPF